MQIVPFTYCKSNNTQLCYLIPHAFSQQECQQIIATLHQICTMNDIVSLLIAEQNDAGLGKQMYERVKNFLPAQFNEKSLCGFANKVRVLRYKCEEQDFLYPHYDKACIENDGTSTLLTVQLYLNEGFGGGQTRFLDASKYEMENAQAFYHANNLPEGDDVQPETGLIVVHAHNVYHCAMPTLHATKYALRIDILYK